MLSDPERDDPAVLAFDHAGDDALGEAQEGKAVQLHEPLGFLQVERADGLGHAVARAVDEDVHAAQQRPRRRDDTAPLRPRRKGRADGERTDPETSGASSSSTLELRPNT